MEVKIGHVKAKIYELYVRQNTATEDQK